MTCFDFDNHVSFKIIDKTNSKLDLKIKETLDINEKKPNLNAQQNHLALFHHNFAATILSFFFFYYFIYCFHDFWY